MTDDSHNMEHPTQLSITPSQLDGQPVSDIPEPPRSRLTTLPPELIHEICSYLCPHCTSKNDTTSHNNQHLARRATNDENWVSDEELEGPEWEDSTGEKH
jgi:hypothetical protein